MKDIKLKTENQHRLVWGNHEPRQDMIFVSVSVLITLLFFIIPTGDLKGPAKQRAGLGEGYRST